MMAEMVGWSAAIILLATVMRQVYTQWRSRSTLGLSRWLFLGQLAASTGFLVYSWSLRNWVFVATNLLMFMTAVVGQAIYVHNHHNRQAPQHPGTTTG
jgi:MtN3 and saliva related transmembrane protein